MRDTTIHVAYADDQLKVRKGILSFMEKFEGVSIDIEAENGRDLIKQLDKCSRKPDIIILDIHMPHLDGFETVHHLKERWPDVKILVLTGFDTELYLIRMITMGVNGYLLKGVHPDKIKEALESIHEYGFYYYDVSEEHFFKKVQKKEILLPHFTDKELEFLKYSATDLNYRQIASKMSTTVKAIDGYTARLCEKLHVKGRIGVAVCAIHFGFAQVNLKEQSKSFLNYKKHRS